MSKFEDMPTWLQCLWRENPTIARQCEAEIDELNHKNKESFFSGLAVALQSVSLFDNPNIAEEIIKGLGSEQESFYAYLEKEGGVDAETLDYLLGNEI